MMLAHFTAAGLYYLAELIEEYSILAKKIITCLLGVSRLVVDQGGNSLHGPLPRHLEFSFVD